jgi:hypothetical protein
MTNLLQLADVVSKKRIFYLSCEVKIQFFKTFILPYFNYCLSSLIIYFPKQAMTKLAKVYYNCLLKLFKFKFIGQDVKNINLFLKQYNFFFEYRAVFKLHSFAYNIKNQFKSTIELKNFIKCKPNTDSYNLKESLLQIIEPCIIRFKYGEWSFQNFFAKLFNNINISRHLHCVTNFKEFLIVNI